MTNEQKYVPGILHTFESDLSDLRDGEFFLNAFEETKSAQFPGLDNKAGPHYPVFRSYLKGISSELAEINPDFTPEYLAYQSYRSDDMKRRYSIATPKDQMALSGLTDRYIHGLWKIGDEIFRTSPPPGDLGLDRTEYTKQHDDFYGNEYMQACMGACFRMVFHAVTGNMPSETTIIRALQKSYGEDVVTDDIYWKVFATDTYKSTYPGRVKVVSVLGAALDTIRDISDRAKKVSEEIGTYAVALFHTEKSNFRRDFPDVQSELVNVLHSGVLLNTGDIALTMHDPSHNNGRPDRIIPYASFYRRWAVAFNRAHVIISFPS